MGIEFRRLQEGDLDLLLELKEKMSDKSRDLFCPYPWDDDKKLRYVLRQAIGKSESGTDASYIIIKPHREIVGHCFLWKAGINPHSQPFEVRVPELGICIVDAHQNKGFGRLGVQFLITVAKELEKDAIELTTAQENTNGFDLYSSEGFEYTGLIRNPLEVDVTEVAIGEMVATKFRVERQMAYIINMNKKNRVLEYLASKRKAYSI